MGRPRTRVALESGPRLDLADLIPRGGGKPGARVYYCFTFSSGEIVSAEVGLGEYDGSLRLRFAGQEQTIRLVCSNRHFGGVQWYALCPTTSRRVRVLYRPPGAHLFASRHAWGRQVAYASQFEDPIARAHRTQAKAKRLALGDADPNEWDFPPKPKRMRWATYNRLEAMYDEAEARMDEHLCRLAVRLLGRL